MGASLRPKPRFAPVALHARATPRSPPIRQKRLIEFTRRAKRNRLYNDGVISAPQTGWTFPMGLQSTSPTRTGADNLELKERSNCTRWVLVSAKRATRNRTINLLF
jgi:hypothetical protein